MDRKLIIGILLLAATASTHVRAEEERKVGALGHLTPRGGIIGLAVPTGDRIALIHVKDGDRVKKGDELVTCESKSICELEVALAESAMREADELGAQSVAVQELKSKEADEIGRESVQVQESMIKAARVEHGVASRRLDRFRSISGESISQQQMDERKALAETTQFKLETAVKEHRRASLSREIGLQLANSELSRLKMSRAIKMAEAKQRLDLAREKLARSVLRAPVDGTVLEVLLNVGETGAGRPVIRMADLDHMMVVADVFERDLLDLAPGMKATVTGKAFSEPLSGEVESIGRIVSIPGRTAAVRIRLDDSRVASRLIDVEVDVTILLKR